jgi:hypothetical protein
LASTQRNTLTLTVNQDKFDKNMITFKDTLPNTKDYWDLFQTTGWNDKYNFTQQDLENAIKNSWYSNSIYDFDKLIGFGRVIADGVHRY